MKLYQRYFCYGTCVTSIFWVVLFYLYNNMNNVNNSNSAKFQGHHLKPRHTISPPKLEDVQPVIKTPVKDLFHNKENLNDMELIDIGEKNNNLNPGNIDLGDLSVIHNAEDQKIRDEGYRLYAFNQLVSDRIGFHRDIPDTRYNLCQYQQYPPNNLPSASVIICFYNEAWSALLRTVHSIIDRTPRQLLHEIILVDDSSDLPHLGQELENYLSENVPTAKLVRTSKRQGLIRARIFGAKQASGEVIVFLDSHCEVNTQWLEPLLSRIQEDSHVVAVPIIDIINMDTMKYEASPLVRGGFNWGLFFRWDQVPPGTLTAKEDFIKPLKSPTMAGGLFAIDRQYFSDMGEYDPGLDIWGGENLEISFRIWQCGGRLEILPCSRVGHIFRKRRPYGNPQGADTMTHNSLRVAHVWLDEYTKYYFQTHPGTERVDYGDISARLALRRRLQCQSFKWYLDNVYPEQTLPTEAGGGVIPRGQPARGWLPIKSKVLRKGMLYQREHGLCVVAADSPHTKMSMLKMAQCGSSVQNERIWYETESKALQLAALLCLDFEAATQGKSYPRLMKCHFAGGTQEWVWRKAQLLNPASGKCLSSEGDGDEGFLILEYCDNGNTRQHFKLTINTL